jgi:3-dehydroquinate synthase
VADARRTSLPLTVAGSRVVVEGGALDRLGTLLDGLVTAHRAAIVTDSNVGPLYAARATAALARFSPFVVSIPAGEANKTRETWARVTDDILSQGLGRDGLIVALGGGVVGDLAGFVAATYLRGVPVVQVPTSLLAMIDASIGGKTAVDVRAGKNLVGAFHPAVLVAVDPELLSTLPERELRSGRAEAIKHGAIADAEYFDRLGGHAGRPTLDLVARSIEIKADIVNADPRESGRRKILNFGHTLGHAVEAASGYQLSHGESIAIGMVLEARLGEHIGVTATGTAAAIIGSLERVGLPTGTTLDHADLIARTHGDKKARGGVVEYALPVCIGRFEKWTTPVPDTAVRSVLAG